MFSWLKRAWVGDPVYPPAPDDITLYAIGDVHGRADLLDDVHARIDRDAAGGERGKFLEIYLGDYLDRGPDSAGVLDRLLRRGRSHAMVLLKGNHEAAFEGFLRGEVTLDEWRSVGGGETLLSYGVTSALLSRPDAAGHVRRYLKDHLPSGHLMLIRTMRPYCEVGPYLFVHAGIEPNVPLAAQDPETMMWIRESFLTHTGDFGHIVIHGHTPAREPEFLPNRINIDTGAYLSNRLTCLRIGRSGARAI